MKKRYACFATIIFIFLSIIIFSGCSILDKDPANNEKIKNLRDLNARVVEEDIVYDGTEKRVTIALYDGESLVETIPKDNPQSDFRLDYRNNVNAGEAKVYIYAEDESTKYMGNISVTFVISPVPSATVDNVEQLKQYCSSGNYLEVKLGEDLTLPQNNTLRVNDKTTLNLNGKTLYVEGAFDVYGCLKFESDSVLYLHSVANIKSGTISANGTNAAIYSDAALELPAKHDGVDVYIRTKLTVSLDKYRYDYSGEEITPAVISDVDAAEYDVVYENNKNVGTATVVVTAKTDSKYVFGTHEKTFSIVPVEKMATDDATLAEIMKDKNHTLITLAGSFSDVVVPEGYDVIVNNVNISGDLTVNGKLTVKLGTNLSVGGQMTVGGTFTNEGNVILTGLQNDGKIDNYKKLTLNGNFSNYNALFNGNACEIYCNGAYVSGENSTFINNGLVYYEGAYNSAGETSNNDTIYFFAKENVTSVKRIENYGYIYSDIPLADIIHNTSKGKSVTRREITNEFVSLYVTEFNYDGKVKSPIPIFVSGSTALTVETSDYVLTKRYVGSEGSVYDTIKPGVVDVTITFKKESKSYTGTIVLQYEIVRGIYTITKDADFDVVFADNNYATALISGKFSTSKDLVIPEYSELKIEEDGGLVYTGTMQVFGEVNNYGNLAFAKTGVEQITIGDGGSINNVGNMYFNEAAQIGVISGDGEIYVRTEIQQSYIIDLPDTVVYNTLSSDGMCPNFKMVMDGSELIVKEDYMAVYSNNKIITTINSRAKVTVHAQDFSKHIYGTTSKLFNIERGTIIVDDYDDMKKAFAIKTGDVCNFSTIYLGRDLMKSIGAAVQTQYETITIPKDTVLDCGEYVLDLRIREGYKGSYKIENYGTIKIKKAFPNVDYKYDTMCGGEVIGETNNMKDLVALSKICSRIDITGDITNLSGGTYEIAPTKCDLVIDLHGHRLVNIVLELNCSNYHLTMTSTGSKGTVIVKIKHANMQITFDNLNVKNMTPDAFTRYVKYNNCNVT